MPSRSHFQHLVAQHKNRVFSFARYYLGNMEDAEDVTQEVFVKLWKSGMDLEESVLPAWLTRVTKNTCVDLIRKRQTYQAAVVTDTDYASNLQMEDHQPSPDRAMEQKQMKAQIQQALDKLDEPYRSIVVFREIQDMDYQQIADSMELPLNTVKVYLHRARKMLREQLMRVMRYETA